MALFGRESIETRIVGTQKVSTMSIRDCVLSEEEVIASKACVIHYRKFGGLYILSNMQQKTISIEKYLSVKMVILHCSVAYLKIRTHLLLVLLLLFFLLLLSLFCI